MSKEDKNKLFDLVKAMSKPEKRQFKLYTSRLKSSQEAKYLELFEALDTARNYQEKNILKKTSITKAQLPNVKSNLYSRLLESLSLSPQLKTTPIKIREQLNYATILYNKGLYQQSLKILDKAKRMAFELDEKMVGYEIVEFEKTIETQFITRSMDTRADDLAVLAKELSIQNVLTSKLSNLSLQIYSFFLKNGYAKNEEDFLKTRTYFHYQLPKYENEKLGFREELYLNMAFLWYSLVVQDFLASFRYASKWVRLFEENEDMIQAYPVHYLRGKNYLLESLFFLRYYSKFEQQLEELEAIAENKKIISNNNTRTLSFMYTRYNQLNKHFLKGSFDQGIEDVLRIEKELKDYAPYIDEHHVMVFYYKFACVYFGAGNFKACIYHLDKIVFNKMLGMREDLLCYARILRLICFYEDSEDENLEGQLKSTFRFLVKMNDLHEVQKEIIQFIRNLNHILPHELNKAFKELYANLKKLENHPYEKRSFLYLDILSWLESKIENRQIHLIIQEKAASMK